MRQDRSWFWLVTVGYLLAGVCLATALLMFYSGERLQGYWFVALASYCGASATMDRIRLRKRRSR